APDVPAFVFPRIHVVWGMRGDDESEASGGVSSAAGTGSNGRSVSAVESQAAGTPQWDPHFDLTHPVTQQYLRSVCDVIFVSGLIAESASTCLMTAFEAYNRVPTNVNAQMRFPLLPETVTR